MVMGQNEDTPTAGASKPRVVDEEREEPEDQPAAAAPQGPPQGPPSGLAGQS